MRGKKIKKRSACDLICVQLATKSVGMFAVYLETKQNKFKVTCWMISHYLQDSCFRVELCLQFDKPVISSLFDENLHDTRLLPSNQIKLFLLIQLPLVFIRRMHHTMFVYIYDLES